MLGARRAEPGALAAPRPPGQPDARPRSCGDARASRCATSARCAPRAANHLLALGIQDRRFGWPLEMVLRAGAAGWTIGEVSVRYRRRAGRSKVTGTVRGTARAMRDMAMALR